MRQRRYEGRGRALGRPAARGRVLPVRRLTAVRLQLIPPAHERGLGDEEPEARPLVAGLASSDAADLGIIAEPPPHRVLAATILAISCTVYFKCAHAAPLQHSEIGIRISDIGTECTTPRGGCVRRKQTTALSGEKTTFRAHCAYINFASCAGCANCANCGISNLHILLAQAGINSVPGHHISKHLLGIPRFELAHNMPTKRGFALNNEARCRLLLRP